MSEREPAPGAALVPSNAIWKIALPFAIYADGHNTVANSLCENVPLTARGFPLRALGSVAAGLFAGVHVPLPPVRVRVCHAFSVSRNYSVRSRARARPIWSKP